MTKQNRQKSNAKKKKKALWIVRIVCLQKHNSNRTIVVLIDYRLNVFDTPFVTWSCCQRHFQYLLYLTFPSLADYLITWRTSWFNVRVKITCGENSLFNVTTVVTHFNAAHSNASSQLKSFSRRFVLVLVIFYFFWYFFVCFRFFFTSNINVNSNRTQVLRF